MKFGKNGIVRLYSSRKQWIDELKRREKARSKLPKPPPFRPKTILRKKTEQ